MEVWLDWIATGTGQADAQAWLEFGRAFRAGLHCLMFHLGFAVV